MPRDAGGHPRRPALFLAPRGPPLRSGFCGRTARRPLPSSYRGAAARAARSSKLRVRPRARPGSSVSPPPQSMAAGGGRALSPFRITLTRRCPPPASTAILLRVCSHTYPQARVPCGADPSIAVPRPAAASRPPAAMAHSGVAPPPLMIASGLPPAHPAGLMGTQDPALRPAAGQALPPSPTPPRAACSERSRTTRLPDKRARQAPPPASAAGRGPRTAAFRTRRAPQPGLPHPQMHRHEVRCPLRHTLTCPGLVQDPFAGPEPPPHPPPVPFNRANPRARGAPQSSPSPRRSPRHVAAAAPRAGRGFCARRRLGLPAPGV
jgi:hypothetical protein